MTSGLPNAAREIFRQLALLFEDERSHLIKGCQCSLEGLPAGTQNPRGDPRHELMYAHCSSEKSGNWRKRVRVERTIDIEDANRRF